mgnify:FL=1
MNGNQFILLVKSDSPANLSEQFEAVLGGDLNIWLFPKVGVLFVLVVVLQYGNKSLALLAVLPFGYQIFSVNLVLLKELLNILWAPFALVQELDQAELDFS